MSNKIFITIYGLDPQVASLKRRNIKDGLESLGLSVVLTIVSSEARDLVSGSKESWATVIYHESSNLDWKKIIKTVMDTMVREVTTVLISVDGIISQNKEGIF